MRNLDSACRCFSASWAESHAHLLGWLEGGPTEDHPSLQALQPFVPGADTDPRLPGRAGLGPIPLDQYPPQVQQEDITLVEAVPGELHLRGPGSGRRQGSCCLDPGKGPQPAPAHVGIAPACHLCAASCVYECGVVCVVYV